MPRNYSDPEYRAKLSAALRGRSCRPFSPEHRANLSAAHQGRTVSAETRAKLSAAARARSANPEYIAKLSAANRRRLRSDETCAKLSATLRRDEAGYGAAHNRVYYDRGPAAEHACIDCGGPATQWSFNHDTPPERVRTNATGQVADFPFSLDPDDYEPRCRACHRRYDEAA